ncbi:MAG: hypothetical protein IJN97_08475 [Oscillospiraceae bacterium]|nr:hypothetical protein [Oscillospiraceae bacterium]
MATFFNQATLSYSGGTVNSNITTGEILEVLSVTKTAVVGEYSQGSEITYVINILNSGNTAFTGLTVTDDLGAYEFNGATLTPLEYVDGSVKYFINGDLQAAPSVTAGPPLAVSGITVPAGSVATIAYTAQANGFAPPAVGGTVENTATVSGAGITDLTASETVTAEDEPRLDITKSLSPSTVTENGQITYTFVIRNTGNAPADATDNVVITDTFNPALSGITVTYNGTTWTTPESYTYDEATGLFTTIPGQITVPAATFTQDPTTGVWVTTPGSVTLTVTGTI